MRIGLNNIDFFDFLLSVQLKKSIFFTKIFIIYCVESLLFLIKLQELVWDDGV
ncbi:hypothetical protein BN1221_05064c [Brenneria goodwinii]|uniref:Uncharacterized protein n=1 Tax=Brenneria goodwinii TaxID=1109412 RepID=A0A0G4K3S5_9GAMM|nr:hypothetical protein BN1221_05064c [Brenneria goodwinii]